MTDCKWRFMAVAGKMIAKVTVVQACKPDRKPLAATWLQEKCVFTGWQNLLGHKHVIEVVV